MARRLVATQVFFNGGSNPSAVSRTMERYPKTPYDDFDPEELYSLDCTIAAFVLPRIKEFQKYTAAVPGDITEKKWISILKKVEIAMDLTVQNGNGKTLNEEEWKKVNKGIKLFGKWFNALWF